MRENITKGSRVIVVHATQVDQRDGIKPDMIGHVEDIGGTFITVRFKTERRTIEQPLYPEQIKLI